VRCEPQDIPEGHSKVRLVGKGKRSVTNTLQLRQGILKQSKIVRDTSGNGGLNEVVFHEDLIIHISTGKGENII
jgi:hypothetical protein